MAIQKTIVYSCPTGDFADSKAAMDAFHAASCRGDADAIAASRAISQRYFTTPVVMTWSDSTKTLTIVQEFADEASATAYYAEYSAHLASITGGGDITDNKFIIISPTQPV